MGQPFGLKKVVSSHFSPEQPLMNNITFITQLVSPIIYVPKNMSIEPLMRYVPFRKEISATKCAATRIYPTSGGRVMSFALKCHFLPELLKVGLLQVRAVGIETEYLKISHIPTASPRDVTIELQERRDTTAGRRHISTTDGVLHLALRIGSLTALFIFLGFIIALATRHNKIYPVAYIAVIMSLNEPGISFWTLT